MSDHEETLNTILQSRLIGIIRLQKSEGLAESVQALVRGGFKAIEITLNTPGALEAIAAARESEGGQIRIGAGTVRTAAQVRQAAEAGAQFIVSPDAYPEVIAATREAGLVSIPGALTPTEVASAHRAGADLVKVFPANLFGPPYIKTLLGPLDGLRLVPTGGVRRDALAKYFEAGAGALAFGSSLVNQTHVNQQDWDTIARAAAALVSAAEYLA